MPLINGGHFESTFTVPLINDGLNRFKLLLWTVVGTLVSCSKNEQNFRHLDLIRT